MKRSSLPPRKTELKRTPMKRRNARRRAKRFTRAYGSPERAAWVTTLPCCVCGSTPSQNAHVISKAAGGGPEDIAPLCHAHHREQHAMGIETFQARYGVDLSKEARKTEEAWRALR